MKDSTLEGNLANAGSILFEGANPSVFNRFNITGDYLGFDGQLNMGIKVEGKPIENDFLSIGGVASGTTKIHLRNPISTMERLMIGRAKLIETSSSAPNTFQLVRDKYGKYRYRLFSEVEGQKTNWYIEQSQEAEEENPIVMEEPKEPEKDPMIKKPKVSSGVLKVSEDMALAQNMFAFSFHDRTGGNIEHSKKSWARLTKHSVDDGLTNSDLDATVDSHYHTVQFGYDIDKGISQKTNWVYGIFGNYAYGKTKAQLEGQEETTGKIEGYGFGIYGSLQANKWYLDHWTSMTRHRNMIHTTTDTDYHFKGFQTSIELGYRNVILSENAKIQIEPQAQVIYSYFSKPDLKIYEAYDYRGRENVSARLGLRLTALSSDGKFKPFAEYNYWNSKERVGLSLGEEEWLLVGNRDMRELKIGFTSSLWKEQISLWLYGARRFGQQSYRDKYIQLGLTYRF